MIRVSGKFTLQALIPITTWPSFGSIGATSSNTSFSAGPNSLQINAFIVFAFLRYRIKIEGRFQLSQIFPNLVNCSRYSIRSIHSAGHALCPAYAPAKAPVRHAIESESPEL